jgi:hypothetical protein
MNNNRKIDVVFPSNVLPFVAMQCNNDFHIYEDPPYIAVAEDFLRSLQPRNCLELGAGLGRMSHYFYKRYGWKDTRFYLLDGDSGDKQLGGIRHSQEDEFYNAFEATAAFCEANSLSNYALVRDVQAVAEPIDFIYSFASIGFHWHLNLYLDKLLPKLAADARLMFELRAPNPANDGADATTRQTYQSFYDSQLAYAAFHPDYEIISLLDLRDYDGYHYKDPTHYLILAPK